MTTNIVPSYPGVYVESVNKLALSVGHSATAVPVFAVAISNTIITKPTKIDSWMDYTALSGTGGAENKVSLTEAQTAYDTAKTLVTTNSGLLDTAKNNIAPALAPINAGDFSIKTAAEKNTIYQAYIDAEKEVKTAEDALTTAQTSLTTKLAALTKLKATSMEINNYTALDKSLRTYFENGGGYCWLMPTNLLVQEVPNNKDITLLVAAGEDIKSAVATLCVEGSGLFAILDADNVTVVSSSLNQGLDESAFSAAYFPWLNAQWNGTNVTDIPPSAAMAGIYCQVDASRGVWKAPANVALKGGLTPQVKISDNIQGLMNKGKAINMIRDFGDGTPMVWGARTCQDDDLWRYIPVRRLFNSAERDIRNAMNIAMFEPNNQPTWERVKAAITRYLSDLWQAGALAGEKPEEAFFVQCAKDTTMNDDDIAQGKMIVKVGMAAVRPAEFIILQFTQDVA